MRRFLGFVLLFCILCATLVCTGAQAEKGKEYGFISVSSTKLYADAELTAAKAKLSKYDIVVAQDKSGTAIACTVNGVSGYVAQRDVTFINNGEQTAVVNKSTKVYIHPSTSSKKANVSKGTKVNLINISGSWAMIERNGACAYIQKSALTITTGAETAPARAADPEPQEAYGLANAVTCDFYAKVNVSMLSFYNKPAAKTANRIMYLKSGYVVKVLAYNGSWAYVQYGEKTGYCQRAYLKKVASAPVSPSVKDNLVSCAPFTVTAAQAKVYIYDQPDTSSKYLGYIVKGIDVTVDAYGETWAHITYNGRSGYSCKSNFTVKTAPAATPAPTSTPVPAKPVFVSTDEIFTDTSTTNEQKVFLYLSRQTDYNEAVTCGIMASINQESRFNPESGKGKSYQGICQWSSSRFKLLTDWCSTNGFDPYSLEGQVKFLYYDLSQRYTVYHKALLAIANDANGAYEAGHYFCYHYERPASLESSSEKRGTAARDTYWKKYME